MYVLGIESSCDETSVAVLKDGKTVLSNVVLSQIDIHKEYGGVVPEIASREHVKGITRVFDQALKIAKIDYEDVGLIAVTEGPGLIGSLLIGINAAKTVALRNHLPIVGVHHIAGHIYANHIDHDLTFPLLALVVSGGHTELILMRSHWHFEKLGETQDDAVGEAYDKIARVLKLPYPGGPAIDKLAMTGLEIYHYPRPKIDADDFDFSFSGLKSHVINQLHHFDQRGDSYEAANVAKSFQEAVTDVLVEKTRRAAIRYQVKQVIVAGGVAANKGLRQKMQERLTFVPTFFPAFEYCGDNAAMIASAGYHKYLQTRTSDGLNLNGNPRLTLT